MTSQNSDSNGARKKSRLPRATEKELRRIKLLIRLMSFVNNVVFRASGGRLGNKFPGGDAPVGLLTTIGQRSGARRTVPLIYLRDGERIVLVASQGGAVRDPLWRKNLAASPQAWFRTAREDLPYRAATASAAEKQALWPRLCALYPPYADYQARTEREIPVLILTPSN